MEANNKTDRTEQPRRTLGQRAKKAGLFLLFGAILFIPRIRRLRRRPGAWACVRLVVAAAATWLVWRHTHGGAGVASMVVGILFFVFALLVHAKPLSKSVDAIANELGALIVLNGGTFRESSGATAVQDAQILVLPAQIIVLGPNESRLLEIPMGKFQSLTAQPHASGSRNGAQPWEVEVSWMDDGPRTTTFIYEGTFAEHLAQVAESTLRSQWKKELPILPQ